MKQIKTFGESYVTPTTMAISIVSKQVFAISDYSIIEDAEEDDYGQL